MSVRVCYIHRAARGRALTGLRLVGQGVDESWSAPGAGPLAYESGAAWIRERLGESRAGSTLTLLCLDADGGVCSWVHSTGTDDEIVASLAREGNTAELSERELASGNAGTPTSYLAGERDESTVQALVGAPAEARPSLLPMRATTAERARRLAVLATADVPGRLMIDSLDGEGITVERTTSVWHALASAWDRKAKPGEAEYSRVVATVCLAQEREGGSRLMWTWSQAGELLVGGAMRVGTLRAGLEEAPDGALATGQEEEFPALTDAERSRLVSEWLSWAAQTGRAPERIVCVLPPLPDNESGVSRSVAFAQGLGESWQGATVDLVTEQDPLGASLRRLVEVLDSSSAAPATSRSALTSLSRRPGRQHRRMFLWGSLTITAIAAAMGLAAWRLSGQAETARLAADAWKAKWQELVQTHYPVALELPRPGEPPRQPPIEQVRQQIAKYQDDLKPADRPEATMPVLQELDSLSLLLGNPDYHIESIELDSFRDVKLNLQINSLEEAEQLLESLKSIEGLNTTSWEAKYPQGNRPEGNQKLRMTYTGVWNPELRRKPARGGG